jgi:hypothetical protein
MIELPTNGTHRNAQEITPRTALAESCYTEKIGPRSVWRAHLFAEDHRLIGYVRAARKWGRPGFSANFYGYPDNSHHTTEMFTNDEAMAARFLIALAKEFWP